MIIIGVLLLLLLLPPSLLLILPFPIKDPLLLLSPMQPIVVPLQLID